MAFYNELNERGLVSQATHAEQTEKLFTNENGVKVYTGFDPTANSLHVGHLIPIMGLARAQQAGHHPIALIGGGTAIVGDPSGKSEMRKMLTRDEINQNANAIKNQLSKFIEFDNGKATLVNNLDWLSELNYLEMLRDVGRHFSVNRMLTAECFKARMESGLSFLEFNYMILQAYDFLHLQREYNCKVQLGGDDQWSNMIAGVDLIRRVLSNEAYAITYPLLTTSDGKKMGKTEGGAVWLDPNLTSPYEYFQYWRNVPDDKVAECLAYFTFLSNEEVAELASYTDQKINESKVVLAYEATKILHGEDEANKSKEAALAAFSSGHKRDNIPRTEINESEIEDEILVTDLIKLAHFTSSNNEGRRLIKGGGIYINGERITDQDSVIPKTLLEDGVELRKGKKHHHLFKLL
jgi:tyrosyl-tRNA synthetase